MTVEEFREAMRADFDKAKNESLLSATRVAVKFGKSPNSSWPYQLMDGDVPFSIFMLDHWIELTGGEYLMRALAGSDYVVARVQPESQRGNAANTVRKFGEYLATTAQADADGKITHQECADIVKESSLVMGAIVSEVHYYQQRANRPKTNRAASLEQAS